ncbi:MAG: hypothetical protein KF736_01255 [Acidobacteria bacterium]|nr:hypothetical protein [Acidobacteriota bacterium]MCW5948104.1 hypothetical protein [Pyrinomonadaceae bacterium]
MKRIAAILLILAASAGAWAQETPLTQAEYVKMLYSVQRDPSVRKNLIEALRKRGIDFAVTDGLRGLTRSKAGADEELARALEEAGRRRADPKASALPSTAEARTLLETTRRNTLAAVEDMPDFVVKQLIARSAAVAGTGNFRSIDRLVVAVSYRSTGEEEYRLLSKDGVLQADPKAKGSYEEAGGTSSTGEFVTVLATIFKTESDTKFDLIDTDTIRGRRSLVFEFATPRDKARQTVTALGSLTQSAVTGMRGRIWIDRELGRVLRIDSEATEIPAGFPITSARRMIDYDWVTIADEKYLLPSESDVRLTGNESPRAYETRNVIRFREYQKYGTEVIIREDDETPDAGTRKP